MALHLYRRHRPGCEGGHAEKVRSGEFEERKKGWKRCACVIFISGTLGGRFSRKATGTADWHDAHQCAETYENADSWTGIPKSAPVPIPEPAPAMRPRITIEDACKVFLATREACVAYPTYRKYKTFTKQLQAFAASRGYVLLEQFKPADIDVFFTTSTLGPRSKAKMLERLRSFFRFAVNREWLPKSPVSSDLKPPTGSHRLVNKAPFTSTWTTSSRRATTSKTGVGATATAPACGRAKT